MFFVVVILKSARSKYQLQKFCEANNFQCVFNGYPANATKTGLIFSVGRGNKYESAVVIGDTSLGRYVFESGAGKNSKSYGYIVGNVKLKRMFPHILFDNKRNNSFSSNLPVFFSKDQIISLEGNFDDYFTTYVPDNYHVDVLSFVTPELMEKLIIYCPYYDVEIIDDQMYIYGSRNLDYKRDIPVFLELFSQLSYEFNDNAKHYRDDRVVAFGAGVEARSKNISSEGKRLKKTMIPILVTVASFSVLAIGNLFFSSQMTSVKFIGVFIITTLVVRVAILIKNKQ